MGEDIPGETTAAMEPHTGCDFFFIIKQLGKLIVPYMW